MVVLTHRIADEPGYPFAVDVRVSFELRDAGLAVTTTGTNGGEVVAPYGAGYHPYLRPSTPTIDDWTRAVNAASYLPPDERGIPGATVPGVGPRSTSGSGDLSRASSQTPASPRWAGTPRGGARCVSPAATAAGLPCGSTPPTATSSSTPVDTLPEVDRRRRGLAVEADDLPAQRIPVRSGRHRARAW